MRTIKKSDFNSKMLLTMKPREHLLVQCENWKQMESTMQMCYNTRDREPREDVAHYEVDREKATGYVLITAVGHEVK